MSKQKISYSEAVNEIEEILKQIEKQLGREFIEQMHIHISGIKYSDKGEREHLNLRDSDLNYKELLKALIVIIILISDALGNASWTASIPGTSGTSA
jgi:endonuclease IV